MFKNYFKTAIRNLLTNKIFSFINIIGLAIGLACSILIVLYIKDELSYDRFHKNIDNIYQLTCDRIEKEGVTEKFAIAAMVQGPAFKQAIPEIAQFVRVCPKQVSVKNGDADFIENITWADENFFTFFSFPLTYGNANAPLADPHSVVLTEISAKKYFGSLDVIGKILQIEINNNFEPFRVTAIAAPAPENSSIKFNVILPFKYLQETNPDNGWMWVSYPTYFLLNGHADLKSVQLKMQQVYKTQASDEIEMNHLAGYDNKFLWSLHPFKEMHLNTEYKGSFESSDPMYYRILSGIALFILAIACINFINLSIANSLKRHKEVGVRKVLGGIKKQLIIQFLFESFCLCAAGFFVAFIFARLSLPEFNELAGKRLSFGYLFDKTLLVIFLTLFLLTCFLSGFYPSLILSAVKPVDVLYSHSKSTGKNLLMNILIVVQFSLTTFFIIAVAVMYTQFNYLTKTDLGYDQKNLLEFTVEKAVGDPNFMKVLQSEFQSIRGIGSVGYCNIGKFGGKTIAANKEFEATYQRADEKFISSMGIHLVAGRNFSATMSTDSSDAVLINEAFARQSGWKDPIAKTIDFMNIPGWGNKKITVIGVVKDYHFESLKEKIKPLILTMDNHLPLGKFVVRLKAHAPPSVLNALEKKYQSLLPGHPFQYVFKEEANRLSYDKDAKWKSIVGLAACLMIFISCIGLFGFSLLVTKKRAKEIAIRKVLGSSESRLLALICGEFSKLVSVAFIIAAPLGWWSANKWLQGFAYRAEISWTLFVMAGIFVALIVLITVGLNVAKASRANPILALRQ